MSSKKQLRQKREAAILNDPQSFEHFFKIIAAGEPTKAAAEYLDLSVHKILSYIKVNQALQESYDNALEARAHYHGERIEKIANDVETGDMDAAAGRVSLDARKFLASRYSPQRWGDKTRVDLTVTDINKLHLDAIRELGMSENLINSEGPSLIES